MTTTAANRHWAGIFVQQGWSVGGTKKFGPAGFVVRVADRRGHPASVIVTQSDLYGEEWLHASMAYEDHNPSYDDLALLHRAVFGRLRWSYLLFPPQVEHVNIHPHALHLWGKADGTNALPNFGEHGTI